MIHYALTCEKTHRFDGWFASSAAFESQRDSGQVQCAVCGSIQIDRALMADGDISGHPGISTSTLRLKREDLLRFVSSTGHEPVYIDLPDPREEE